MSVIPKIPRASGGLLCPPGPPTRVLPWTSWGPLATPRLLTPPPNHKSWIRPWIYRNYTYVSLTYMYQSSIYGTTWPLGFWLFPHLFKCCTKFIMFFGINVFLTAVKPTFTWCKSSCQVLKMRSLTQGGTYPSAQCGHLFCLHIQQ